MTQKNKKKKNKTLIRQKSTNINWIYDSSCNIPILKLQFSISVLCFRYIGHTWPSNRPGGSGTVYCLVLKIIKHTVRQCIFAMTGLWKKTNCYKYIQKIKKGSEKVIKNKKH